MDRRVDRFVGAEHDHRGGNLVAYHPFHDLDAANVGQHQVEDDDIDVALIEAQDGVPAGAALFDDPAVAAEQDR